MSAELILEIDEIRAAGLVGWRELPAGLCNRSFMVETRRGNWVLRLNGEVPGVDREVEARVLETVAAAGLAPPLIACDPRRGYLISERLDGPVWGPEDLRRPRRLAELARRLRLLHRLEASVPTLDLPALLRAYLNDVAPKQRAVLTAAADRLLAELERHGYFEARPALCHHDPHASNIIGDATIRFVDWEFACLGQPALDLGFVIQYHDLSAAAAGNLVAAYFGRAAGELEATVALAVRLARLLELLWLDARARQVELPPRARRRHRRLLASWR